MLESTQYYINRLVLQVSNKGLVVQVHEASDDLPRQDRLSDLPDWAFHSPSVIWFADGETNMYGRALAGEEIKKELMAAMG